MTDLEAQLLLVGLVQEWLSGIRDTAAFVQQYWRTRRKLLDSNPSAFDGPVGEILSHMDVALHSYWPEPESEGEIGEVELRTELTDLLDHLRQSGFPLDETA